MKIIKKEPAAGGAHYADTLKINYQSAVDGLRDWALLEPGRRRTWVVVLHGHGSHGDQIYTRKDVATLWLAAIRERGLGILSPNLRDNAWMCPAAVADLHDLIALVRREYEMEQCVILSGSMGGTGALIFTVNQPEDIAGVCALCPATDISRYQRFCRDNPGNLAIVREIGAAIEKAYGGTPATMSAIYKRHSAMDNAARLTMPVYLVHGDNDALISVEESRALAAALARRNAAYVYKELPGGDHDAPIAAAVNGLDWICERAGVY